MASSDEQHSDLAGGADATAKAAENTDAQDAKKALRPRDAATLVLVDSSSGEPRILMGRRRRTQVFMPNKVVFPGGRVDDEDRDAPSADELNESESAKLLLQMKGRPSIVRARSMAMAAIRETFEETGIIIGQKVTERPQVTLAGWQPFCDQGYLPRLADLCLFARAITPPGRPRLYDTRFFCASVEVIAAQTGALDDELSDVGWYTIAETADVDLPPITRVIIEDLGDRLKAGPLGPMNAPVPFYHQRNGTFMRELLTI